MGVRADSTSNGMIQHTRRFSLNVLAADQKDLAATFFKPQAAVGGRFEAAFELGSIGFPILKDALGGVECELVGELAHGDHTVFVGEVKSAFFTEMVIPTDSAPPAGNTAAEWVRSSGP